MVRAIVGANWGDEGKGKLTDMLAEKSDIVVRFQGGANAGHTIVNHYGKFALHTLPSGVFYDHTTNIIGNGVALNIPVFFNELKKVTSEGVPMPKILISDRAQMVMPYHVLFDQYEEERLGKASFGSTKSGIAPFYSDKYAKIGFQVQELFDEEALKTKIKRVLETKNILLEHLYHKPPIDADELFNTLMEYKEMVAPYVCDVSAFLWNAIKEGKNVLLEGQLGSLLKGNILPAKQFTRKDGKKFTARLKLDEQYKIAFDFSSGYSCPLCGKPLFANNGGLFCRNEACGLRIFKNSFGHTLTDEEMKMLVTKGKTKKMTLVNKVGKEYEAFLYIDPDNKEVKVDFLKKK